MSNGRLRGFRKHTRWFYNVRPNMDIGIWWFGITVIRHAVPYGSTDMDVRVYGIGQ